MTIHGICRDAPSAEAVDDSPNEAQPSHCITLDPLPVAFHDALGHLLEEAAGVACVLALAVLIAVSVGMKERASSVGRAVVELVDGVAASILSGG